MKKNLVISPAVGLEVEQIAFFIKSLRRYYKIVDNQKNLKDWIIL
jgi:hypothetical protein